MVNGTVQMYGYKITRYELKRSICRIGIFTTTSEQELYYHFTSYIKKDLKVIILMPDSLQGDGYRKTTHPQPIYNVVICNVNSVCCLYHAKSFKNIRFCDTVIVETMLVMKIIQHFSCHT